MAKLSCPYCYHRIEGGRLGYLCAGRGSPGRPGCKRLPRDPDRERETGYKESVRRYFGYRGFRRPAPRRVECPECGGESGIRACPTCHTPLSSTFGDSESPLIAMVGAKGTGKSVYLTVLAHELRGAIRRRFGADVRLAGDRQGDVDSPLQWVKKNEQAVFARRQLMGQTAAAVDGRSEPLVFEWRQERSLAGVGRFSRQRTTHLSFYDTAGEDLSNQDHTHDLTYLAAADALIVLLDPFTLGPARDRIALPPEAVRSEESAYQVLTRVTEMLRSGRGVAARKKIPIPVAVAFAKVDAFFEVLGDEHPVVRVPPAGPDYDETAGQDTHEHIRALLDEWGADDIDSHLRLNYQRFRYFGISALGAEPDYATAEVDPGGVRPHRVDEPLVWLLTRFGVLPAREHR